MLQRLELLSLRSDKVLLLEWLLSCSVDPAPSSSGAFSCAAPPPTVWKISSHVLAIPRSPAHSKMWVLSCSLPFGICECCSTGEGTYISHMWACALPLIICPDPGLPLFPSTLITINLQRVQEGAWSMTPEPLLSNFLINQVIIPHLSDFNRKTTKLFQGRGLWNLVS